MENEPCRLSSAPQELFHWKSIEWEGPKPPVWNTDSQLSALCSKSRVSLKLGANPKELAALTSRPSLNIELTLSQISEETLESLKLRERNSRASSNPRANQATTEGHPQSDVTQRRAEFLQATQRHFNLKASIKQNLYKVAELVVSISKVRIIEFSSWWSTRVKSCGNSRTVLYFNHSQFIACVYVFCFMLFSLVHVL